MPLQWRPSLWIICQWNIIMSKSAFAQAIISKLKSSIGTSGKDYSAGSASAAMSAVAAGITEYLIANTTVMVSYVGVIPGVPPTPDPLVTDSFKIMGSCAPTGPSNSFDSWIKQIETNIIAGFQLAAMGNGGLVFPQKPFLSPGIITSQANLKATHDVSDEDPQQKVWEVVCGGIMDWINGLAINVTPGAATHPAVSSTGTATITKITIT